MKHVKNNLVPLAMLVLAVISFYLSGVSLPYLASEVYTRFIRNILFTLALILPVTCGMGINFDIVVIAGGVIPAQDYDFLYKAGVAAIFGPGTPVAKAACQILEILMDEE